MSSRPVHSRSRPLPQRIVLSSPSKHDAVGHALQDAFVLNQAGDVDDFGKVVGVGIDADIFAAGRDGREPGPARLRRLRRLRRIVREGRLERRVFRLDREPWDVDTSLVSSRQYLLATLLARSQPGHPWATREFSRPPTWHYFACEGPPFPGWSLKGTHQIIGACRESNNRRTRRSVATRFPFPHRQHTVQRLKCGKQFGIFPI